MFFKLTHSSLNRKINELISENGGKLIIWIDVLRRVVWGRMSSFMQSDPTVSQCKSNS